MGTGLAANVQGSYRGAQKLLAASAICTENFRHVAPTVEGRLIWGSTTSMKATGPSLYQRTSCGCVPVP